MQEQPIPINPSMLQWARLEAGLSLQEAADRARVSSPRQRKDENKINPEDRLASWEKGDDFPSLNQLEKIAKAYCRPLLTFFLPQPPIKIAIFADFRTVSHFTRTVDSPEFAALKRRIIILHRELCELAVDEHLPKRLSKIKLDIYGVLLSIV
jgi:transcriptional regulator with XRE-family HTH domain